MQKQHLRRYLAARASEDSFIKSGAMTIERRLRGHEPFLKTFVVQSGLLKGSGRPMFVIGATTMNGKLCNGHGMTRREPGNLFVVPSGAGHKCPLDDG